MVYRVSKDWDLNDEQDHSGFFIAPDECVVCGVCQLEAPNAFSHNDASRVYAVVNQPKTPDEIDAVINAFRVCCVDCIYYGGKDPQIISKLRAAKVKPDCIVHGAVV